MYSGSSVKFNPIPVIDDKVGPNKSLISSKHEQKIQIKEKLSSPQINYLILPYFHRLTKIRITKVKLGVPSDEKAKKKLKR